MKLCFGGGGGGGIGAHVLISWDTTKYDIVDKLSEYGQIKYSHSLNLNSKNAGRHENSMGFCRLMHIDYYCEMYLL